jgi:hypothetical protein
MDDFQLCRNRLDRVVATSCLPHDSWPARIAVGIYSSLEFAAADPVAARTLTAQAAAGRIDLDPAFVEMIDHFAGLLRREVPARRWRRAPDARSVVLLIARQAIFRVESGRPEEMVEIAPELALLTLTPYLGYSAAKCWSERRPQLFAPLVLEDRAMLALAGRGPQPTAIS